MSTFDPAIKVVLQHEGGYVNNPNDPGGATKFGISLRFLKGIPEFGDFNGDGIVDIQDIKNMDRADAVTIYKACWWDKYKYYNIDDQTLATKVFDLSVNMGANRAHILLQQALNNAFHLNLDCDGVIGPATLSVINELDDSTEQILLTEYCNQVWGFYQRLIANKPSLKVFEKGWKNRAYSLSKANMVS